jgi:GxxExxY protein
MHDSDRLNALSRLVIGCAFTVLNTPGAGYPEKVYENALALEPRAAGLRAEQQRAARVYYRETLVGVYFADIVAEDSLLLELKVASALADVHRLQCLNDLKASGLRLGLLLNFGNPRLEIRRVANGM